MTSKPPPFSPSKLFKDDHDQYPGAKAMLKAQILPIKPIKDRQSISASSDCSLFQQINVLSKHRSDNPSSISSQRWPPLYVLDPDEFKPTYNDKEKMKKTLKELLHQINSTPNAVHRNIYTLNGSDNWGNKDTFKAYKFVCRHSNVAKKGQSNQASQKLSSCNNTRKNDSKKKGNRGYSRRSSSIMSSSKERRCPCRFKIFANDQCFFLQQKNDLFHNYHNCISANTKNINLSQEEKCKRQIMQKAINNSASIAIGMKEETGKAMTRQECRNRQYKDEKDNNNGEALSLCTDVDGIKTILQIYCCQVLTLKARKDLNHTSDTKRTTLSSFETCDPQKEAILDNNVDVDDEIGKWIKTVQVHEKNEDLICVAWQNSSQHSLALAFNLNLNVDSTHKTCSVANLSMLTLTCKDSFGETKVFLRMWIPNEKTWMFRYIMMHVIPVMMGREFCTRVKAITSDGDPQLIKIIGLAIKSIFVNAVIIPCAWHIVDRTMLNFRREFIIKKGITDAWKEWFLRTLQLWIYSFMRPSSGIQNKEEYIISKCILLGMINSTGLKSFFTEDGIQSLNEYLQTKIFIHEDTSLAFLRKKLFNMEVYNNCAHEGTNFGLKSCANPVKPTDLLGQATLKMIKYDTMLMHEREQLIYHEYFKWKKYTIQWKNLTKHVIGIVEKEKRLGDSGSYHPKWYAEDECFYCVYLHSKSDNMMNLDQREIYSSGSLEPHPMQFYLDVTKIHRLYISH